MLSVMTQGAYTNDDTAYIHVVIIVGAGDIYRQGHAA